MGASESILLFWWGRDGASGERVGGVFLLALEGDLIFVTYHHYIYDITTWEGAGMTLELDDSAIESQGGSFCHEAAIDPLINVGYWAAATRPWPRIEC